MTNDKKKDVPKIVPSDKPSIKEVRQDSNEGLSKSAEPQKRGGDPTSSSTSQQERKPKAK